jgi:hypothetical protein
MTVTARAKLILSILLTLVLSAATAQGIGSVELTAPEATPAQGLSVRLKVGALPRGALLEVLTGNHELIGTVSPFGSSSFKEPLEYVLPWPEKLARSRRIKLLLVVRERNGEIRAPSSKELLQIELVSVPVN